MNKLVLCLLLLYSFSNFAQVKGTVTDEKGNPLPSVSVYFENTFVGTSTNESGQYELKAKSPGEYQLVFQYLGYKTQKKKYVYSETVETIDAKLSEENFTLKEVVIEKKDNLANQVIRNAIAHKSDNTAKTSKYEADFYSRGIFRIKDAPKKILGQKFDQFDDILDSTRSGILYLSETVSKIKFNKPDKLKETIVASKVSGRDNGFSFNNAASANFDFYDNYLQVQVNVISPIANNAFQYYRYKHEGTFVTDNNQVVNKIKVIPRRETEPVMDGYIYIVDDSFAIYAVDLTITGSRVQNPALETLTLKQNFSYNNSNKSWIKNSQTIDFTAGMLAFKMSGKFTHVFSNYEFKEAFEKRTFTNEVLTYDENANKKDDSFWNSVRPVPLTVEESNDYLKKAQLQAKKKSKVYLDSIDAKNNRFGFASLFTGYTYANSFEKRKISYDGLVKGISFNTVQGWTLKTGIGYEKRDDDKRTFTRILTNFTYGLAEEKFRGDFCFIKKFSNLNQSEINISGGSMAAQISRVDQISPIINSISTLFFEANYLKLYERNFANIYYKREVTNGLLLSLALDYSERKPLMNHTDYVMIKNNRNYTSNNPLEPYNYYISPFHTHKLAKAILNAKINFGQEYWIRPDGKFNRRNDKYPILNLNYEKGFAGSQTKYEFDYLNAKIDYEFSLGNKGYLDMTLKGGKFYNAKQISLTDYYQPIGNQTPIGTTQNYLNIFNLLPYYTAGTNDSYFEAHAEYNDQGFVMNKLPLLNKLKSTLILGYHNLSVPQFAPYHEYSIGLDNLGFGKFKFFRFDYVKSYQNGTTKDGVVFGLKLLDFLD